MSVSAITLSVTMHRHDVLVLRNLAHGVQPRARERTVREPALALTPPPNPISGAGRAIFDHAASRPTVTKYALDFACLARPEMALALPDTLGKDLDFASWRALDLHHLLIARALLFPEDHAASRPTVEEYLPKRNHLYRGRNNGLTPICMVFVYRDSNGASECHVYIAWNSSKRLVYIYIFST